MNYKTIGLTAALIAATCFNTQVSADGLEGKLSNQKNFKTTQAQDFMIFPQLETPTPSDELVPADLVSEEELEQQNNAFSGEPVFNPTPVQEFSGILFDSYGLKNIVEIENGKLQTMYRSRGAATLGADKWTTRAQIDENTKEYYEEFNDSDSSDNSDSFVRSDKKIHMLISDGLVYMFDKKEDVDKFYELKKIPTVTITETPTQSVELVSDEKITPTAEPTKVVRKQHKLKDVNLTATDEEEEQYSTPVPTAVAIPTAVPTTAEISKKQEIAPGISNTGNYFNLTINNIIGAQISPTPEIKKEDGKLEQIVTTVTATPTNTTTYAPTEIDDRGQPPKRHVEGLGDFDELNESRKKEMHAAMTATAVAELITPTPTYEQVYVPSTKIEGLLPEDTTGMEQHFENGVKITENDIRRLYKVESGYVLEEKLVDESAKYGSDIWKGKYFHKNSDGAKYYDELFAKFGIPTPVIPKFEAETKIPEGKYEDTGFEAVTEQSPDN